MKKPPRDPAGARSFPIPLYGGRAVLCLTRDAYAKVREQVDGTIETSLDDYNGVSQQLCDNKKYAVHLIGVFAGGNKTLVHELTHTTFAVLRHAEVPITSKNEEAFAYLMDALYTASLDAIKRIRRKVRR